MNMRFCEYLKMCSIYIINEKNHPLFMKSFFSEILVEPENDIDYEEYPFGKATNKSKANKVFSGQRPLTKKDAEFIKSNYDENLLFDLIEIIPENVQQNLIDELSQKGLYADFDNLAEIMSDLLRRFIDAAIDGTDEISIETVDDISLESDIIINEVNIEDNKKHDIEDEARRFCIDHEHERPLFALCQIAFNVNPMHKHNRKLYTDYNKCNHDVRNAIMEMNDIPILQFENEWDYEYLKKFRVDIKQQHLYKNKDLLYDGGKYFYKAMEYPKEPIKMEYLYAFPMPLKNEKKNKMGDLTDFIYEYVNHNYNLTIDYKGDPPLEWMINSFNMTDSLLCPDSILAIWLNLFVYSACYVIPLNYERKPSTEITYLAPNKMHIETLEDLHYSALLNLHSIYS